MENKFFCTKKKFGVSYGKNLLEKYLKINIWNALVRIGIIMG